MKVLETNPPKQKPFFIRLENNYYKKGDVVFDGSRNHLIVVRSPLDKFHWLRKVLNKVSFRLLYKNFDLLKVEMFKKF